MIIREPIRLSRNCLAIINIFTRYDDIEDVVWLSDIDSYNEKEWDLMDKAAKQFISQLKGHWCVRFLEQLRNEIDRTLEIHNKEFQKNS